MFMIRAFIFLSLEKFILDLQKKLSMEVVIQNALITYICIYMSAHTHTHRKRKRVTKISQF